MNKQNWMNLTVSIAKTQALFRCTFKHSASQTVDAPLSRAFSPALAARWLRNPWSNLLRSSKEPAPTARQQDRYRLTSKQAIRFEMIFKIIVMLQPSNLALRRLENAIWQSLITTTASLTPADLEV